MRRPAARACGVGRPSACAARARRTCGRQRPAGCARAGAPAAPAAARPPERGRERGGVQRAQQRVERLAARAGGALGVRATRQRRGGAGAGRRRTRVAGVAAGVAARLRCVKLGLPQRLRGEDHAVGGQQVAHEFDALPRARRSTARQHCDLGPGGSDNLKQPNLGRADRRRHWDLATGRSRHPGQPRAAPSPRLRSPVALRVQRGFSVDAPLRTLLQSGVRPSTTIPQP